MTDGGLGCALLWPISLTRYFAPWRPIPVAPIGFGFLSAGWGFVALVELGLFLPALMYALWPGRVAAKVILPAIALWVGALALISSSGSIRDAITGVLLREDTSYATGFSETAFRTIRPGLTEREVRHVLGSPYQEWWFYTEPDDRPPDERPAARNGCLIIRLQDERVASMNDHGECVARGVSAGLTVLALREQLGPPLESCWQYSWSPAGTAHRSRQVCFTNGRVHLVVRKWAGG
jgi:hypothetical protein